MADLPPLVIPDQLVAPVPNEQAAHAADWALTFGRGDTNLAQRAQHNRDLANYAQTLQDSMAAHQAQVLQNNAGARALYFKQQDMRRQQELDAAKARTEGLKEQRAAELHPLNMQAKQAQAAASTALERQRVASDLLKAKNDALVADHTAGLAEHMNQAMDSGAMPGTSDYAQYVVRGMTAFPNADKSLRQSLLSQARVQHTPEEIDAMAQQLPPEQRAQMETKLDRNGYTVTAKSAPTLTPNARVGVISSEISRHLRTMRDAEKEMGKLDLSAEDYASKSEPFRKARDSASAALEKAQSDLDSIVNPQQPSTAGSAESSAGNTEIIVKDGKRYEVNHDTKAVTPL